MKAGMTSWPNTTLARAAVTVCFVSAVALTPSAWGSETVRFAIARFELHGNTLVSSDELAVLLAPYQGSDRVYGDVQKAREAIEGAYRQRGYGAVQVEVPEQELTQGTVRLEIHEARLARISVRGNRYVDEANVLASLPGLEIGRTPNARSLSQSVQLANENPAKKVDVVLGLGSSPGELDARVDVRDEKPWTVYLTSDNSGTADTGRDRTGVALQYGNLFDRDHVATIAYTTSLERPGDTAIYSLSYRLPIYAWGDSVDFIVGRSDVAAATSATVAGPLRFSGSGMVYALRYNHILPRYGEYTQRAILGIDQREYDNDCAIDGQAVCGAGGADVSVRPLSLTYAGQLDTPVGASNVSLTAVSNLGGGPDSSAQDFAASRPNATPHYALWRGSLAHAHSVGDDWQLRGALTLQYTRDALISGEQIGLAGSNAVRGFDERAVTADKGYYGTLEVYTPELATLFAHAGTLRLLAFFDFARGAFNQTPPGLYAKEGVSSAGLGVRYNFDRNVSLRLDWAHVIDSAAAGAAMQKPLYASLVIGF